MLLLCSHLIQTLMSKGSKHHYFHSFLGKRAHYTSPLISNELIKTLQLFSYTVNQRCYSLHESLHILLSHNTLLYDHPAKPGRKGVDDILLNLLQEKGTMILNMRFINNQALIHGKGNIHQISMVRKYPPMRNIYIRLL